MGKTKQKVITIIASFFLLLQSWIPYLSFVIPSYAQSTAEEIQSKIEFNSDKNEFKVSINSKEEVEYILSYQTDKQTEAISGKAEKSEKNFERDLYAGTCSENGTCVKHNVLRGILKTKISLSNWLASKKFIFENGSLIVSKDEVSTTLDLTDTETNWLSNGGDFVPVGDILDGLSVSNSWDNNADGSFTSKNNVSINTEYIAPFNNNLIIKFTKLPENPKSITIKEISASFDLGEDEQVGSVYEITSEMQDGEFAYDLSLPIPEGTNLKNLEVKYAESLNDLINAEVVSEEQIVNENSLTVKSLNHFTVFVLVNPSPPPSNHLQEIVDNTDPGFTELSGTWRTSTSTSGYYGTNYVTTDNHSEIGQVSWNFTPSQSGSQEIFARWTAAANRGTAVPFTIAHDGGTTEVPVNQEQNGGSWQSLGSYSFTAGNSYSVTLTNNSTSTSDFVIGDAIMLQNISDPSTVYVDDNWAGTDNATDLGDGKIFGYNAFVTIQEGVNGVASDGTVNVAAGTYDEQVVIDGKDITLQGAGDTTLIRPSIPAILISTYLFPAGNFWAGATTSTIVLVKNAGTVTLKDFKVDGINVSSLPTTGSPSRLVGVLYGASSGIIDNVTVNNIKTTGYADRTYGIQVSGASTGTYSVEVKNSHVNDWARNGIVADGLNLTANINNNILVGPGTISGQVANGILFIGGAAGNATSNTISGMHYNADSSRSAGILVYGATTAGILIDSNDISDTDDSIDLSASSHNATVSTNNLHNNLETGIQLENGTADNTITGNTIVNNTMAGIRFGGAGDPIPAEADTPPGAGNVANNNTITGNGKGIVNYDTDLGQIFDATNNWWGNVSGPYDNKTLPGTPNYNNSSGTGNSVSSYVDYKPWYKDAAMTILSNTAPAVPTLVSPANDAYVKPTGLILDWSDVTDPSTPITYYYKSSYSSSVGSNNALTSPIYTSGALTASQINASGSNDHLYYWQVRACDGLNNCSDWSGPWSVTIDGTAPGTPGIPSTTTPTSDNTPAWDWTASTDTNLDHYLFFWDTVAGGETYNSGNILGNTYSIISSLIDGTWYGKVKSYDIVNNESDFSDNGLVLIDTTAPTTTIGIVTDGNSTVVNDSDFTKSDSISIPFTTDDESGSGVVGSECQLDAELYATCSTPFTASGLSEGSHTVNIRSTDEAGNVESTATFTWTIDVTPPDAPSITSSSHTLSTWNSDRTIDINWSASDPSGIAGYSYVWNQNSATVPDTTSEGTSTSTTSTNRPTSQLIYFHVRAVDELGFWSNTTHYGPFWVDANNPTGSWTTPINNDYIRGVVNLEASTNDVGSGVKHVVFKIKKTGGSFTTISTDTTSPYQASLDTTTKTDGTYVLQAQIVDNIDRLLNKNINVTIDNTAPATPTATPGAEDYTSDQSVTLESSDLGSGLAAIYYTTDGSTPDNIISTEYTGPITVDQDMTIKAIAYDNAGNVSEILTAEYGIAPVISSESSSSVTSTTTTITWLTDDLSTSRVIYDTVSHATTDPSFDDPLDKYGYANTTDEFDSSPKVTDHSVDLSGLTAGTTYYYRTVSHGSPEAVSDENSLTTTAASTTTTGTVAGASTGGVSTPTCSDTKPGSAPSGLSATAGLNSVTLSWNKANDPVSYYLVTYGLSSGSQAFGNPNVGNASTTSYTVSNLSGGITYYFKVRAGNGCAPGEFSSEVAVTPSGGFVEGPATGFAPGVLGVATEEAKVKPKEEKQTLGQFTQTIKQNDFIKYLPFIAILLIAIFIFLKRKNMVK